MGGAWGSAETLARLPQRLESFGILDAMLGDPVPAELEDWFFGLGIRTRELGPGTVVAAHSGLLATHAAEVAWIADGGYAVAILTNIGRPYKATLQAALDVYETDESAG